MSTEMLPRLQRIILPRMDRSDLRSLDPGGDHIRACIFSDKVQTAGVSLCIHFLVQSAMADGAMRFTADYDRRKSRPWLARRRICLHRGKCKDSCNQLPFSEKLGVQSFLLTRSTTVDEVMSNVLPILDDLLRHAPPSPRIVFALRMAASLICTRKRFDRFWRQLRRATLLADSIGGDRG